MVGATGWAGGEPVGLAGVTSTGLGSVPANDAIASAAPRAAAAAALSSAVCCVCWSATGKMAATMMNPIPRITTANITSANENPRRAGGR